MKSSNVVRFNDPDEWLQELKAAGPNVDDVVRLTRVWKATDPAPMQALLVVGSYLRQDAGILQTVELRRYCGDVWRHATGQNDWASEAAEKLAGELLERLTAEVVKSGHRLAGGMNVPPEQAR